MRSTRPGIKILIGVSAASIHCTGDSALVFNKRSPTPGEKYLIISDGNNIEVDCFGCVDVVIHCAEDVAVTLTNVAFVPGVPFDLFSLNVIQEERVLTLDHNGAHMLDGRVFFHKKKFGNYVEATRKARHQKPPTLAAVVLRPGKHRWKDVNDLHCFLGHAHIPFYVRLLVQWTSRLRDVLGIATGARWEKGSAKPSHCPRRAVLRSGCSACTSTLQNLCERQQTAHGTV